MSKRKPARNIKARSASKIRSPNDRGLSTSGRAGTAIELRPLFERFCEEAIGPAVAVAVEAALKDAAKIC
jgi:hypothetical protein